MDSFNGPYIYIVIAAALGLAAGLISRDKGYHPLTFGLPTAAAGFISFWVLGVIGVIVAAAMPHRKIPCPKCGLRVVHSTIICPNSQCGHNFSKSAPPPTSPST